MSGEATSGQQVADEAERVFDAVVETSYSHENFIDAAAGVYNIDCNGYVGFVLEQAAPEHYREVPREPGHIRPRAFKYYDYFANLPDGGAGGWLPIHRLADARRGDVIAWRLTVNPERDHNTGHVMIVADAPIDDGGDILSVRVYDSSDVIHFDDTRGHGGDSPATGVGMGTVRLEVNSDGTPISFQFGPAPDQFHSHPIAIGRIEPLNP